jgi:glycosyltransferase involved in cell wall biosynthesis
MNTHTFTMWSITPAAAIITPTIARLAHLQSRFRYPDTTRCPQGAGRGLRILSLADEWFPTKGGISTINRALCTTLAAMGHEVFCLVPAPTGDELADALTAGVRLMSARPLPGVREHDMLLLRPSLPEGRQPDLILGHGRITGPAALVQAEDNFPGTARLHFVHMCAEDTEVHKSEHADDLGARTEERSWTELDLARSATRVVAVGPRLHQRLLRDLSQLPDAPGLLRFDPGCDSQLRESRVPPPGAPRILLLGRLEDAELKGLDIAARAIGYVAGLRGTDEPELEFRVRGAVAGQAKRLRKAILEWSGVPSLHVEVANFSVNAERLCHEMRLASLVLMPSRAEGFGLVGLEAIAAGVPVLVSHRSGLGQLLRERLPYEDAARVVIQVDDDLASDTQRWGAAIAAILRDRKGAFANADEVRRIMAAHTWEAAVGKLLADAGWMAI